MLGGVFPIQWAVKKNHKARPITYRPEKPTSIPLYPYTASKAASALIHSRLPATHPPSPQYIPAPRVPLITIP